MKTVLHVCLNGPFTENWGYQENILSKYHAKLGHSVTIIAQNLKHIDSGEIVETELEDYVNQNGVRVIRVAPTVNRIKKISDIFPKTDVYTTLKAIMPDLIMIHGLIGNLSALQVRRYIENVNQRCICVADIHQDSYNSRGPKNKIKYYLLRTAHRLLNGAMYPYYKKVYYVAPSSRKYAKEYYNVPDSMLDLLPLGCDPELIKSDMRDSVRKQLCDKYDIHADDIIICHGGKLNSLKGTKELIDAVKRIYKKDKHVKLILFGTIHPDYEAEINRSLEGTSHYIFNLGHLLQHQYYDVFVGSDIAVFPGSQSALWQQAIACGLAVIIKEHTGTDYLNLGGNIRYLKHGDVDEIHDVLGEIIQGDYLLMKEAAMHKGMSFFSYKNIAQKVIDDCTCEAGE